MKRKRSKEIVTTKHFNKQFEKLPQELQEATYDKLELLLQDTKHPSLRVKRMKGTSSIWEMSITMNYRITFEDGEAEILLRKIGTHDILKNP